MELTIHATKDRSKAWDLAGELGRASVLRRVEQIGDEFRVRVPAQMMTKACAVRDRWEVAR